MKKKNKKNKVVETTTSNTSELKKLIIFIVITIVLFGVFYVISLFIDSENKEATVDSSTDEVTVIQYDEILVGTALNQNSDSYYVLITSDDNLNDVYSVYKSAYELKDEALKMYTADIDSPFNKDYIAEESNFSISQISDLKIKEDTLIKIEDSKLVEYFEGKDDIVNELKNISE